MSPRSAAMTGRICAARLFAILYEAEGIEDRPRKGNGLDMNTHYS